MPDPLLSLLLALFIAALLAGLFWPQWGLYHRLQRQRRQDDRVLREDALKHLHRAQRYGRRPTLQSLAGDLQISLNRAAHLLEEMAQLGLVGVGNGDLALTPAGAAAALHIIRAHRLWELYLAEHTGFEETEWHGRAEQLEHAMAPDDLEALALQLGNPTHDPHGDPIPDAAGQYVAHGGQPLTTLAPGERGQIVHLEDEPEVVYAQLAALGLHPGQRVEVIERSAGRVRFWANGDEHVLAPLLALNISVQPLPEPAAAPAPIVGERLSDLRPGEWGEVTAISRACRGSDRRRLLDLGVLPGARVQAAFASPGGDPTAYLIRDTLIALRRDQAGMISVVKSQ
ncbi:MAG: DtxR family transcriptional regulator [Caldilineales bacterium]|nr:DtxR family transcriptional regulator [Caldilineales bacterium]